MKTIAIIGAGISGLTAANLLKENFKVKIFEKSRGVSGRTSTRREGPYFFDHGAQFFKAKTKEFQNFIQPMITQGIIKPWLARFVEFDRNAIASSITWNNDDPHYVGVPGMNAIAKYLSNSIDISLNTKVRSIIKDNKNNKWNLIDENDNNLGEFDWVISAIPAEQAKLIIPNTFKDYSIIESTKMQACFSLMLGFNKPLDLDFDVAFIRNKDIIWISVNSSKPERKNNFTLLIHSTNNWADKYIDDDKDKVIEYLCIEASSIIGKDVSTAECKAAHGWRYANIAKQSGPNFLIENNLNLGVCGDWLIQGRVESAFISGLSLAKNILNAS